MTIVLEDPSGALAALRAELEETQRTLAATQQAWKATTSTKDALAMIAGSDVLVLVRNHLNTLTDAERERFFYEVERGFCGACGRKLDDAEVRGCQCTNDE